VVLCVQVLPFAEEETLAQLERNIINAGSLTDMMSAGMSARVGGSALGLG
jgi:hypothetical protein